MKTLVILFLFLLIANFSFAQQETLAVDTSFGENGIYTEDNLMDSSFFIFENKIYIAGKRGPSTSPYFTLIRLNMDGTPDMTFNAGSNYYFNYPQFQFTEYEAFQGVIQQPDGKFLVMTKHLLFRINLDGYVDTGFGNQGMISYNSNVINFNVGFDNGKIYRIYNIDNGNPEHVFPLKIERLNINGEIDLTYGENGIFNVGAVTIEATKKSLEFFSNGDLLMSYANKNYIVAADGENIIHYWAPYPYSWTVDKPKIQFGTHFFKSDGVRLTRHHYNEDGIFQDGDFGIPGWYYITIIQFGNCFIQVAADNKFYILGHHNSDFVISRRLENGLEDNTFSGNSNYTFQNVPSNPNEHRIQSYKLLNNDIYILAKNVYSNQVHIYKYNIVEQLDTSEQFANSIKIYPNPATDKLYFENLEKSSTVKILNAEGKFIMEKTIEPKGFIDISALPKGVYVVILDGSSYKFIKN